jgi:hypothetical protein
MRSIARWITAARAAAPWAVAAWAAAGLAFGLHAAASANTSERWTMTSGSGHATLAFNPEGAGAPELLFICGISPPGYAQVMINRQPDDPNDRRFRVEFAAGPFSAMASGEPSAGSMRASGVITAEITIQQMRDLLMTNAPRLSWRIDTVASRTVAQNLVIMPHILGRLRTDFLRFCV